MKRSLEYQKTIYDCGPQSYINALLYLYDITEIPPDFIKTIYQYSLDEYHYSYEYSGAYHGGTSPQAMRFLTEWFNMYAKQTNFPIYCEHLSQYSVWKDSYLYKWVQDGGVAILRVQYENYAHYVLLISVDVENAYIFDSFLHPQNSHPNKAHNTTISIQEMHQDSNNYFIGNKEFQNAFLLKRK